jgi:porin
VIGEVQCAINQAKNGDTHGGSGLPGTYNLGFWYDTGGFPDPAIASNGVSLASPASSGVAAFNRDNYRLYAVADQTIWASARQPARTINIFAQVMGAPGDRNLIGFSLNGGVTVTDPLPGRPHDSAGIDIGVGTVGSAVAAYDRTESVYRGGFYPVQSTKTLIEATYQVQLTPW